MILFLLSVRKNEGYFWKFARKYNELNLKNKQNVILKAFLLKRIAKHES